MIEGRAGGRKGRKRPFLGGYRSFGYRRDLVFDGGRRQEGTGGGKEEDGGGGKDDDGGGGGRVVEEDALGERKTPPLETVSLTTSAFWKLLLKSLMRRFLAIVA